WKGQEVNLSAQIGQQRQTIKTFIPLLGDAGIYAASAALAVAWAVLGDSIDLQRAANGLKALRVESGRLRPRELQNGAIVIDDAYNANPASMRDSIQVAAYLAKDSGRKLTLVLGEMRELGTQSEGEHRRVGEQIAGLRPDLLVATAGDAYHFANVASKAGVHCEFAKDAAQATDRVLSGVGDNDVILVKGSRGVALEQVVAALDVWGAGQGQ
ncbi:MAG: UDP-N-acetylmuramoylalanyl-D-glutamyl-2, 6-diaminopimelate--D-alanyl-D-alanine ligase, partial [Sorangium cellulosum]